MAVLGFQQFWPNFHRQDLGGRHPFSCIYVFLLSNFQNFSFFYQSPNFRTFPFFIGLFYCPIFKTWRYAPLPPLSQRAWLLLAAVFIFWLLSLLTDWDPGFREKMPNCNPTSDLDDSKILLCKWIDVQPAKRIWYFYLRRGILYVLFHLRHIKC